MIKGRPYQEEINVVAKAKLKEKRSVLIQAPTGAGKTIVFSLLIKEYRQQYPSLRICVLVHREILVRQNAEKMRSVFPECEIGIACKSSSHDVNIDAPVVFGSVQTLVRRMDSMKPFHLVIIDEAHRLPPKDEDSQYRKFLARMEVYFPRLRILGLTATPFRLNHGPIYGNQFKRRSNSEDKNWFDALDHQLTIRDLQNIQPDDDNPDAPYLCGVKFLIGDRNIERDLAGVRTVAGEFNQADLSNLMGDEIHIGTAVDSYLAKRECRTRCVVFGVDIKHAERLVDAFRSRGVECDCVHSEIDGGINRDTLQRFEAGELPVVVNVGVLTEGWDCKPTDMMILARPTKSSALYVQMVGRGLRTSPGKTDCLVIDLGGNVDRHGPPWMPKIQIYPEAGKAASEPKERPNPMCPECGHRNSRENERSWVCENCGAILEVKKDERKEAQSVQLREIDFSKAELEAMDGMPAALSDFKFDKYQAKSGSHCLRVRLMARVEGKGLPIFIQHFYRLEGAGQWHFCNFWNRSGAYIAMPFPRSIEDAVALLNSMSNGDCLKRDAKIQKDGQYWKVVGW